MIKLQSGEISQQDLSLTQRLLADVFWNVTDGEVDGVGCLAMKLGELGFVG